MKAYILKDIGQFTLDNIDKPIPNRNEVLVKVKSAGICGSDIPRVFKTGTYHFPTIPGHEFSGIVEEIGQDVDSNWLKKRVGIFPLIPCMECESCENKTYEMCENYNYLGSRTNGGFAEYVKVPVWNLIELPTDVTFEQAAMLEPMAVAVHSIRKANIKSNDKVAVCGLGTIGIFIVMFLQNMGIKNIYCVGNKEYQREFINNLGINKYNDLDEEVDVYFDCVGKNEVVLHGLDIVKRIGKIILVGNPTGDMNIEKNTYWKILRKQLTIYGTWNSSFTHSEEDDWHYVLERINEIHPERAITHKFSLDEFIKGFYIMKDKTESYIKIITNIKRKLQ